MRSFCLDVCGFVSRPVRETLALNALERERGTFPVLDLAGVPFEISLYSIAVQVSFADRMVRPENGTLHQGKAALGSVGAPTTGANILFLGMVDRTMKRKFLADIDVMRAFVRHQE